MMEYFQPRPKITYPNLPFISRPSVEQFCVFVSERDGFEALIHHNVKEAISREALKALPNETIGLLAGRVLRDERGPYTLVLAAQGARPHEIDATPSHVHISANGHARVRSRLEGSAFGLDVIGWYHSHPRFPARFSPVDVTEQSTWRDPNHIGIVISGNDQVEPFGVYRGPQATLLTSYTIPPPLTLPPPTLSQSPYDFSEAVIVPPHTRQSETLTANPLATQLPNKPQVRSSPVAKLFPGVLALSLLGMLLSLVWLNRRMNRIEGTLTNSRYAANPAPTVAPTIAPIVATAITPGPLLPASAEKSSLDPTTYTPKVDLVDRPTTKALVTPRQPARARRSGVRNQKRSTRNGARAGSDSGASRSPATKPNVSAQSNSTKPGVVPPQKPKSMPPAPAEKPAKP